VYRLAALFAAFAFVSAGAARPTAAATPAIGHVFIVVMENKNYDETFGPASHAPYLAKELTAKGQLLRQFYGIGHLSLGNYIAMVSGQAPNPQTQGDCLGYSNFFGILDPAGSGQAIGQGCVYPVAVKTVVDQLEGAGKTWRGYMEDMGNSATESKTCRHPAINSQDKTQQAKVGDQYAARHNPFVYFHSIIDDQARCDARVVGLDALTADLASVATTPNYVFITPNLCHDGHDEPCVDGQPGGLVSIDAFLKTWVPRILDSPAYRQDGLLLVTFDESEYGSSGGDASACCNEQPGFNTPMPGISGMGGGRTGTVVLSKFTQAGSVNDTPYNHYSMLRSIEDLFGLPHLGYAGAAGLRPFGDDVFNAAGGAGGGGGAGSAGGSAGTRALGSSSGQTPATGGSGWAVTVAGAGLLVLVLALRRMTPHMGDMSERKKE
jgi:hypothetical protein